MSLDQAFVKLLFPFFLIQVSFYSHGILNELNKFMHKLVI